MISYFSNMEHWKNQAYYNPNLYPDDLERLQKGLAPIGDDGFSMEATF